MLQIFTEALLDNLSLRENTCGGYTLEAPRQGASNKNLQHRFSRRNNKEMELLFFIDSRITISLNSNAIDSLNETQNLIMNHNSLSDIIKHNLRGNFIFNGFHRCVKARK